MKKWMMALVVALVLSFGVTAAMAAQGQGFTDENSDGVCDFAAEGCVGMRGECGAQQGGQFADENGDGVCDNFGTRQGNGCGAQQGNGYGAGGNVYGKGGCGKGYCGGR